jgi:hypothetical protein
MCKFPWIIERVGARKPKHLILEHPEKTRTRRFHRPGPNHHPALAGDQRRARHHATPNPAIGLNQTRRADYGSSTTDQ